MTRADAGALPPPVPISRRRFPGERRTIPHPLPVVRHIGKFSIISEALVAYPAILHFPASFLYFTVPALGALSNADTFLVGGFCHE